MLSLMKLIVLAVALMVRGAHICASADTSGLGQTCRMKEDNKTGKCIPIFQCDYAVGNLHSGILPTSCEGTKTNVCCPSSPNISKIKCDEFKNVLRTTTTNKQRKTGKIANYKVSEQKHNTKENQNTDVKCDMFLSSTRISGGRNANKHEYPHQVALGYGSEDMAWRCGGVLISEEFVLTAGHCVIPSTESKNGPPKKVLMGDRKLSQQEDEARTIIEVLEIYTHPEYRPPLFYNDIALIKLKSKVKLSRALLPACLPQPEDRLDTKKAFEATGWGQVGALESQSDILQTVTLKRIGSKECLNSFKGDDNLKSRLPYDIIRSQFCAGDLTGIKDTCPGDSGGPLVVTKDESCVFYVVGLTSFGSSFCGYQQPGVYTNVQRYLSWIEGIVWPELKSKPPISNTISSKVQEAIKNVSNINSSLVFPTTTISPTTTTTKDISISSQLLLADH